MRRDYHVKDESALSRLLEDQYTDEYPLPGRSFSPVERETWQSAISSIYEKMIAKARGCPYEIQCNSVALTVLPNVYAPGFFTDSLWFAQQLPQIVGTKSLLEIGTGTGVIAIFCAQNGARVVATDINLDAAQNARLNVMRHNLGISVREGNLFEPIKPYEKFDYIFWAHPFNNWKTPVRDMLLRSGRDYNYEGLRCYIAGAKDHLEPDGKLLLGTGDSADLRTVSTVAARNGYRPRLLNEAKMPLEEGGSLLVRYLLYEFVFA
jgi:release factor glutamine methyltransferase